jgi:hypothetical protein
MNMTDEKLVEWLFENSGPVLRYRIAVDMMDVSSEEKAQLLRASLATNEVQYWLDNLGRARNIHGSKDTDAENSLSKLLDFGFDCTVPAFAKSIKHLFGQPMQMWDSFVLLPFLIRAGFYDDPLIFEWLKNRIEVLYQTVQRGVFDFYLSPAEACSVPKAWKGKSIYRDEFGHESGYPLPTCYDFYALSYCPSTLNITNLNEKCEAIIAFLSDKRFQSTVDGYGWDKIKNRCYSAGRVFLACVMPARLVLFLELGACFNASRHSYWFRKGLSTLENYRTTHGTYRFPAGLLVEKTGNHIYGGSHMGLGENRRSRLAIELGSTFHLLYIQRRMHDSLFTQPAN